jgi:hypothetical protein
MNIDISKFKIYSLSAEANRSSENFYTIRVKMEVNDIYNPGSKSRIEQSAQVPSSFEDGVIRKAVRMFVLTVLEHEVDKCLLVDGTRVKEPKHGMATV